MLTLRMVLPSIIRFLHIPMILDRTIAPDFQLIDSIQLPMALSKKLANGNRLHIVNIGEQPVVRLECIFDAGTWYESQDNAAYFAIKMLMEGTINRSYGQISDAFERIGAFTEMSTGSDRVGIVVYCLSRFLPEVTEIISDLIQNAIIPEKELEDVKNITLQNLRVNLEKTGYQAAVAFKAALFGANHPYGKSHLEAKIVAVGVEEVRSHYQSFIKNGAFTVFIAGQISELEVELIAKTLGGLEINPIQNKVLHPIEVNYASKKILVEKQDSLQSTIRIGRILFTRKHPDYFAMLVTNEILGGYFGSRLMKNIREEKGLTYGISSHMVSQANAGYFMIGADVKKEFTQQTIDEIHKEIKRLQTELVSEDELQTVKNFMAGEMAGSLNTAFEVADRRKTIILDNLPTDFYDQYVAKIRATSAEQVMEMANKYLKAEDMVEVVAGGK